MQDMDFNKTNGKNKCYYSKTNILKCMRVMLFDNKQ